MITTAKDYEESTAFELYVLETVRPAIERHQGASMDLRGSSTVAAVKLNFITSMSAGAIDALKDKLSPLLFGAAWKVVDLMLEFALNKANLQQNRRDWTIAEKQAHASAGAGDRSVLGCSKPVWDALLRFYAATVEHRHCLVHRTATVDASNGELMGTDRNQQPLKPLTKDEQVAFAKAASLTARAAALGSMDSRTEYHLMYHLDRLTGHSGATAFGVGGAAAPVDLLVTLGIENGAFVLDMGNALPRARQTFPTVAHFDVLIDIPDGSNRRLFGRAEDLPTSKVMIDLNALPTWLQYR